MLQVIVITPLRGQCYCKSNTAQLEMLSTDLFMLSGNIWFLDSLTLSKLHPFNQFQYETMGI